MGAVDQYRRTRRPAHRQGADRERTCWDGNATRMKIVVTEPEPMGEEVRAALKGIGHVVWGPFGDAALAHAVQDCEVLVVRLGRYIGASLVARAPRLKFVVSA